MLAAGPLGASRSCRSAGVADDLDRYFDLIVSIRDRITTLVFPLLLAIVCRFEPKRGERMALAIDDCPTKRYGRHFETANVQQHATPMHADGPWLH